MQGLIIGYGRAGKRHGKQLDSLGIKWAYYDPNVNAPNRLYNTDGRPLEWLVPGHLNLFHFAVIATPPDLHLAQIRQCLDAGLPVLCEKPLCDLGQLTEAEALLDHPNAGKVMMAYNYRHHPALKTCLGSGVPWHLDCYQNRELPAWGLLLDHCSHDLDIINWLSGSGVEIIKAEHVKTAWSESWEITGGKDGREFVIKESVGPVDGRVAQLYYLDGRIITIDPDPVMFADMWAAFLSGDYRPGLQDGIETQKLLEACHKYVECGMD